MTNDLLPNGSICNASRHFNTAAESNANWIIAFVSMHQNAWRLELCIVGAARPVSVTGD